MEQPRPLAPGGPFPSDSVSLVLLLPSVSLFSRRRTPLCFWMDVSHVSLLLLCFCQMLGQLWTVPTGFRFLPAWLCLAAGGGTPGFLLCVSVRVLPPHQPCGVWRLGPGPCLVGRETLFDQSGQRLK